MTIFKESGTAILGCLVALGLASGQVMAQDDTDMAKRLAPVGKLCVKGEECQTGVPELAKEAPATKSSTAEDTAASGDKQDNVTTEDAAQTADKQSTAADSEAEMASIDGQTIYQQTCMACHDTGIASAPIRGDAKAWEPRLAQGIDTLYDHAINGFNIMPPRGGDSSLSDEEVKAAVDYMVQ
uniref:c-type cytochrome n=1 Tax=Halomonas sp. TaxID=1486246 RepID=UPI00261168C0|nr:c-type cytochrome [Halomonas sp.]